MKLLPLQVRVRRNLKRRGVKVYTRRQWRSKYQSVYRWRLINRRVTRVKADTLVQHITVTFDSGKLVGDFFEDMQTIERIGYERFGSGFSYNFGVGRGGEVGEGMPLLAKGTHTVNDNDVPGWSFDQNAVARAVAYVGMPGDDLTPAAEWAITQIMAAMVEEGALTRSFDYVPHSFFAAKDCPTDAVRNAMPKMRRLAMRSVRQG